MPPWLDNWLIVPRFNVLEVGLFALIWLAGMSGQVWRLWRARVRSRLDAWLYAVVKSLSLALLYGAFWLLPGAVDRVSKADWAGGFWFSLAMVVAIIGETAMRKSIPAMDRWFTDLDQRIDAVFDLFGRGERYPAKPLDFTANAARGEAR
ncbi:MAG: hypothetical protein JWR84_3130 [Caulobacter sp.]|nr:hypothetical protein [Caulobacter sp.]